VNLLKSVLGGGAGRENSGNGFHRFSF